MEILMGDWSSFTNMSCEACMVKFTLFKRKKQCMDCLHYFCTGCVIRRRDKVLSCDNCSMLSRRPLIKNQIIQIRTRHLRNYLEAKRVNIKGCVEKDDLVNLLIRYINEKDRSQINTSYTYSRYEQSYNNDRPSYFDTTRSESGSTERDISEERLPSVNETRRDEFENNRGSYAPAMENENDSLVPNIEVQESVSQRESSTENPTETTNYEETHNLRCDEEQNNTLAQENVPDPEQSSSSEGRAQESTSNSQQNSEPKQMIVEDIDDLEEIQQRLRDAASERVDIEEISESENVVTMGPEPVITEAEEASNIPVVRESSEMFKEIKTWPDNVKLSDIELFSDLDQLTTKQLKYLLLVNRVDFKGCVERYELMDRVSRLWTEYQQSKKEIENSDMDALCKICLDAPIECVILECGHMTCCIDCGKKMTECPICRQFIVRVVRIFRS